MSQIIELEADEEIQLANLLVSMKNDNFDEFKHLLEHGTSAKAININHLYEDPENKTLLDIACSDTNKAPYVQLLLENGADVNLLNQFHGAAPIHWAVSSSDFDTVKLLAEHKDTDIHQPNIAGKTAFHLAAERKRKDFIRLLQKRQAADIKLTKREILTHIHTRYITDDETNTFIPPKISECNTNDESLFSLLRQKNFNAFASKANEENVKIQHSDLEFTYLQYACKLGLTEFVELLLNLNVDPNETSEWHIRAPIAIAAFHGYHNIVALLLDTGIITYDLIFGENILHSVMEGFNHYKKYGKKLKLDNSDDRDYLQCLKLILDNVPDNMLEVDLRGPYGLTPLGYAIDADNRDMILLLLERGAYIGVPGWLCQPVIQYMKPDTLEYFLDRSMSHIWTVSGSRCLVKFNYNFLTTRYQYCNHEYTDETKPLLAISEVPELRPLLKHPLFLVFLDFKWHIILRTLYYTNLAFHLQFVLFLSIYLLAFNYVALKHDDISLWEVTCWSVILLGNSIMFVKEFTRLIIHSAANKCRYVTDIKNWMEITLIAITYVILFCQIRSIRNRAILAATAIFLSYVKLILLILSHPRMCVRIEMFKSVALNSLKFLMSYLILILAFAFSFFILFKDTNSTNKSFNNVSQAVFKTLLMSTGEYELSDIQINDEYGISRLVIILFIFLIPTVLFNLLNAIAVSDIQSIRKDAELVSVVVLIKLITHTEEVISTLFSFLNRLANYYDVVVGRQSKPTKCDHLPKRYYYTNYFVATGNGREIVFDSVDCQCTIDKYNGFGFLKFPVSPFTRRSIREKLNATNEEGKVDPHPTTGHITQETATSQESCMNLETLKDTLKHFEEQFRIIELKLAENTKLLNEKLK